MQKILVIQHVPFEGLGKLDHWFQMRAITPEIYRFFEEKPLPDLKQYSALIILGGPMGTYDLKLHPWLEKEFAFIESALEESLPILGICLGAQILAQLLGGSVNKQSQKEIGWYPISLTEKAKKHPLFSKWPEEFVTFHWHQDTFIPPKEALKIGSSAACDHQGFAYEKKGAKGKTIPIVGLQFHLEMTQEISKRLVESCHEDLAEPGPYIGSKTQILSGFAPYAQSQAHLFSFLDQWFAMQSSE